MRQRSRPTRFRSPGARLNRGSGSAPTAEPLRRAFEIDVLVCPWCGGKRKLIALLTGGKVVRAILEHLGLPTAGPVLAPARSPSELEFAG